MIYGKSLVYEEFCGPCLSLWEDENGVKKCDIQMQSSMDKENDKEEVELKKKMGKESTLHSVPKTSTSTTTLSNYLILTSRCPRGRVLRAAPVKSGLNTVAETLLSNSTRIGAATARS